MNDGKDKYMCKYYHPELAGCCYAQKDAPKVYCKGERCNCELPDDRGVPEGSSKYLIKKLHKNGAVTKSVEIIRDDELIFTFADIADDLVFDDIISILIIKSDTDGRANDGKDNDD